MENQSKAFWVGLFVIVLTLFILFVALWVNVDRRTYQPFDLLTTMDVGGLYPDADVRFRGLNVGKVQFIHFDEQHLGAIRVRILVSKDTPISTTTFATLGVQGVTGIAFVQLDNSEGQQTPLNTSMSHVTQIPLRPGFLERTEKQVGELLTSLNQTSAAVNHLINEQSAAEFQKTLQNISTAAKNIGQLSVSLQPIVKELPGTIYGFNQITDQIRYETLPRMNNMMDQASQTAKALNSAIERFERKPMSLLFGVAKPVPGPGEQGFVWSNKRSDKE